MVLRQKIGKDTLEIEITDKQWESMPEEQKKIFEVVKPPKKEDKE